MQNTDVNRQFSDFVASCSGVNDDRLWEQSESGRRVISLPADTASGSGKVEAANDFHLIINSRELRELPNVRSADHLLVSFIVGSTWPSHHPLCLLLYHAFS